MITIKKIEFDIFGFSRGAAAARHCSNEILKPGRGVFGELLTGGRLSMQSTLDSRTDVSLNFIGLFDTVAAVANLQRWNWSVSDAVNHGVNLYLPPDCARKVIQLSARDECRLKFALNTVKTTHQEIALPGVHSDIGGGYLPYAQERLILTRPRRATVSPQETIEMSMAWKEVNKVADEFRATGLAGDGKIEVEAWTIEQPHVGGRPAGKKDIWLVVTLNRTVRGELSRISLRVMRELAVRYGVPFDVMDDEDSRFKLPDELELIAKSTVEQALRGSDVLLGADQNRLLVGRYIHRSAHWGVTKGIYINKPAPEGRRLVHPHAKQKGYPE